MEQRVFRKSDIDAAFSCLRKFYSSFDGCGGAVFYEDSRGDFRVCTKFQAIFKFASDDPLETALHRHVVDHLYRAELVAPGSFDVTLDFIVMGEMNWPMDDEPKNIRRPSRDDVRCIIERFAPRKNNAFLSDFLMDVFEVSGFNGKVVIERSNGEPHIERVDGYSFPLKPAIALPDRLLYEHPRVVCIEGHIDSFADGHFLFQQVHESGEPCILFCRGLSDEVKHNLKVNWDRGRMKIVPFIVEYGMEGANTLVDISTICGNDMVSTLRGDRISSIDLTKFDRCDRIDVSKSGVVVLNARTTKRVVEHLNVLKEKHDASIEAVQGILKPRIHTLLSGVTYARLPDDTSYVYNSQLTDFVIRTVRSALDNGVQSDGADVLPAATLRTSATFAGACLETLENLGAVVTS